MGIVYAPITLSNPRYDDLLPISLEALVDTGSMFSCVPEHIAIQLRFETIEHREVTLLMAPGACVRMLVRFIFALETAVALPVHSYWATRC
jgi:hypothetical protein